MRDALRKNLFAHHEYDFGFNKKRFLKIHGVNNVIGGVEEHKRFDRNFENTPLLDLLAKGH